MNPLLTLCDAREMTRGKKQKKELNGTRAYNSLKSVIGYKKRLSPGASPSGEPLLYSGETLCNQNLGVFFGAVKVFPPPPFPSRDASSRGGAGE